MNLKDIKKTIEATQLTIKEAEDRLKQLDPVESINLRMDLKNRIAELNRVKTSIHGLLSVLGI